MTLRLPLAPFAAIVLAAAPAVALAAEKTISFEVGGEKVVGTMNLPDGVEKPPVILLLHGFTGSRDELEIPSVKEGVFARAARMWAENGIASLRIDFRNSGDSDGDFADTTVAAGRARLSRRLRRGRRRAHGAGWLEHGRHGRRDGRRTHRA
jgi:hypothetical protein